MFIGKTFFSLFFLGVYVNDKSSSKGSPKKGGPKTTSIVPVPTPINCYITGCESGFSCGKRWPDPNPICIRMVII
jgi:hypothetical protein